MNEEAVRKIKLTSGYFGKYANLPRSSSGTALYAVSDGVNRAQYFTGENSVDSAWEVEVKQVFSSPRNIRKILVRHDAVVIRTYAKFHCAEGADAGEYLCRYKRDDAEVIDYAHRFRMCKGISNGKPLSSRKYSIEVADDLLRFIDKPWVMANVEEIYFDDIILSGCANYGVDEYAALEKLDGIKVLDIDKDNDPIFKKYIYTFAAKIAADNNESADNAFMALRKRFPRLKAIGIIIGGGGPVMVDNTEMYKEQGPMRKGIVYLMSKEEDWDKNDYFSLSSHWKFDTLYLNSVASKIAAKAYRAAASSGAGKQATSGQSSEFETLLGEIESKYGAKVTMSSLYVLLESLRGAERTDVFSYMSDNKIRQYKLEKPQKTDGGERKHAAKYYCDILKYIIWLGALSEGEIGTINAAFKDAVTMTEGISKASGAIFNEFSREFSVHQYLIVNSVIKTYLRRNRKYIQLNELRGFVDESVEHFEACRKKLAYNSIDTTVRGCYDKLGALDDESDSIYNINKLKKALQLYSVREVAADKIEADPSQENIPDIKLADDSLDGIDGISDADLLGEDGIDVSEDDIDVSDLNDSAAETVDNTTEAAANATEAVEDDDDFIIDDTEDIDTELGANENNATSVASVATADDYKEDASDIKEQKAKLKKIWGQQIDVQLNGVMSALTELYSSGYELLAPMGVLTPNGIIKNTTNERHISTGNVVQDIMTFESINKSCGNIFQNFLQYRSDDKQILKDILGGQGTVCPVLIDFHLNNAFGYTKHATGKYGFNDFEKATNPKPGDTLNDNTTESGLKVYKWAYMRRYIRWVLSEMVYDALIMNNISANIAEVNNYKQAFYGIVTKICNSAKNVILVVDDKKGVYTRIRICSGMQFYNHSAVINNLRKSLNVGNNSSIRVEQLKSKSDAIIDLNIITNDKAYSQDALFAYQITDTLISQGIQPSWNNVVLGKSTDGTILKYNFMDNNNSAIAIYGAKGSGKGVMTLNLISSALAGTGNKACKLVYMDAKPDSSVALVKTAWSKGVDVAAFNGIELAGANLDSYGNVRKLDRFGSLSKLPKGLFTNEDDAKDFILTTTYYRGLELVLNVAEERASRAMSGQKNNDWMVAIFDEVQQLASAEMLLMNKLLRIQDMRKKAVEEITDSKGNVKTQKINYLRDPIYLFIEEYKIWRSNIATKLSKALGSTWRKADITVIYIWQTTSFPDAYVRGDNGSIIAQAIKQEGSAILKFVGRAALEKNGSTVFGTPNSIKDTTWYDEKFTGSAGGYWAMGSNVNEDSMKVFRPFNVYSDINKGLLVRNAEAIGLTETDLIGVSLDYDLEPIPEIAFEGYVNNLLGNYGLNAATQLNNGYVYFDNFVRDSFGVGSLLEFMYNAHTFGKHAADNSGYTEDEDGGYGFDFSYDGQEERSSNAPVNSNASFGNTGAEQQAPIQTGGQQYRRDPYLGTSVDSLDDIMNSQGPGFGFDEPYQGDTGASTGTQAEVADNNEGFYDNLGDNSYGGSENGSYAAPQVDSTPIEIQHTGGQVFTVNNRGEMVSSQNIMNSNQFALNSNNSIKSSRTDFMPSGKIKGFLNTIGGAQRTLDNIWKRAVKIMTVRVNPITQISLVNNLIMCNGKALSDQTVWSGIDGIRLVDIVDFEYLAKKVPTLKRLDIDKEILEAFCGFAGYDAVTSISKLFQMFRGLNTFTLVGSARNPQTNKFQTATFTRGQINKIISGQEMPNDSVNAVQNEMNMSQARKGFKLFSANKRAQSGGSVSNVEKVSLRKGSSEFLRSSGSAFNKALNESKPFSALFFGAMSAVSIGLWAVTHTVGAARDIAVRRQ